MQCKVVLAFVASYFLFSVNGAPVPVSNGQLNRDLGAARCTAVFETLATTE
ncbi:hypothetical protein C8F04DRAFT_1261524 [Mycena alexandri]|uniref:Uncharacterized protein n=1 Tax=Mycena alexandri TaxID=1745969 RepID=A0AAD6S0W2_9AGAR|nr:hypothetical protein C8F04DRAFT_1277684 [Mycena alexandri]KAJ7032951.1 hypothetical protein C8F04DRAFT_1261524 [Mycena alexandri]